MSIYNTNLNELNRLLDELDYCKKQVAALPKGSLSTSKSKRGIAYFNSIDGQKQYIPASNRKLAAALALKTFFKIKINDIENEISAIEKYLKFHKEPKLDSFCTDYENCASLITIGNSSFKELGNYYFTDPAWIAKVADNSAAYKLFIEHTKRRKNGSAGWNYEGSCTAPYQEKRVVKTICGINVRSKSEELIANYLFGKNIIFIYEQELLVNGKIYYPDFIIFHPVSGMVIIIEHGGMFADMSRMADYTDEEKKIVLGYTSDFSRKVQHYIEAGWIPGINLIITSETKFKQFDMAAFAQLLDGLLI